jgi:hypothetical protein
MDHAFPVGVQKPILLGAEIVQGGVYVLPVLDQACIPPINLLLGGGAELDLRVKHAEKPLAVTGIESIDGLAYDLDVLLRHRLLRQA